MLKNRTIIIVNVLEKKDFAKHEAFVQIRVEKGAYRIKVLYNHAVHLTRLLEYNAYVVLRKILVKINLIEIILLWYPSVLKKNSHHSSSYVYERLRY